MRHPFDPKHAAAVLSLLLAPVLAPGAAQATPFPILCYLSYSAPNPSGGGAPQPTARNRTCAVEIAFKDGAGDLAHRAYSCQIAAGAGSCTTTVDPASSGLSSSYAIASANAQPLYSSTEENHGCAYSAFASGATSGAPPGRIAFYPLTFTDPSPEMPSPTNQYPYAGDSDPMPAYTSISGVTGWGVVVLQAFDCASVPTSSSP